MAQAFRSSRWMRTQVLSGLVAASLVALACPAGKSVMSLAADAPAAEAGWVTLLSDSDYSKNWTTKGNWIAGKDKDVVLEPRPGESGWQRYDAYLWSKQQYQDFEIDMEFNVAKGSNSGFYFHVGNVADPVSTGIEVQIYDSHPKGDKGSLNDHDCGGIIPGIPPTKNAAKPSGEWNRFQITAQGTKLTVKLNGETVNEVDMSKGALKSRPAKGYIGFQDHGLPLAVRNIRIRPL